jgi:hypothetical protein
MMCWRVALGVALELGVQDACDTMCLHLKSLRRCDLEDIVSTKNQSFQCDSQSFQLILRLVNAKRRPGRDALDNHPMVSILSAFLHYNAFLPRRRISVHPKFLEFDLRARLVK